MAQQISRQEYRDAFVKYQNAGKPDKAAEIMRQFEAAYPTAQQQANTDQQIAASNEGVDFDLGTMVSNIPSSLYNVAADTAQAVMNPVDTAYAMGQLAKSGIHNAAQEINEFVGPEATLAMNRFGNAIGLDRRPETLEELQGYQIPGQEEGEAFAGALDDRYGSVDNAKTTLMEDPAGMLLDVASLATGAGAGVRAGLKNRGMNTENVDAVIDASSGLSPLSGSVRAPVSAFEGRMDDGSISSALYGSAMKPSTTLSPADRRQLLSEGLEMYATPGTRSLRKREGDLADVGQQIGQRETALAQGDAMIDIPRLFDDIPELESEYGVLRYNPKGNLEKIDMVVQRMMDGIFNAYPEANQLSAAQFQRLKKGIYKDLYDDKAKGVNQKFDTVEEVTLEAIGRAARRQLEEIDPELAKLNEQYSKIKRVQENIQFPAAARVGNRDIMGIGPGINSMGAEAIMPGAGPVGAVLGAFDKPVLKANTAVGINRTGQLLRNPTYQKLELAAGQGGRLEEEALSQFDKDMDAILSGMLDTRKVK